MFGKSARFLRDVWALTRPYWFSEERWAARGLLFLILVLNLAIVLLNVLFNDWSRLFYNALQQYDESAFWHQLLRFSVLAVCFIAVGVYRLYLRQLLQMRWRRWMTERYVGRWLDQRTYYRLQLEGGGTDNPDQRVTEDLRDFTESTLVLVIGLIEQIVNLASFATILWSLSGAFIFPIFGLEIPIPGYMLWAAVVYCAIGTWLTHLIGRPLIPLNFNRQRVEADFRFNLVRFRENVEPIALYNGEGREKHAFAERFTHIMANWWDIIRRTKRLTSFTVGFQQLAVIFPFLMMARRYFGTRLEFGVVMQVVDAFSQVQSSLSWFVDRYAGLAEWKATVDRLTSFTGAMARVEAANQATVLAVKPASGNDIAVRDLDLAVPDGHALLSDANLTLRAGEPVLLSGPSGSGKSTLFRAISGIWPYGKGTVERPAAARILFLPQKPYLPIGSLREVLTYPAAIDGLTDAMIVEALRACELPLLVDRLDEHQHWAQLLSPGEQQRIAFARALLMKPDWLFLDEASAALDEATETRLYQMLPRRLPNTTVVSIGHRPSLRAFHQRHLEIQLADGRWGLHDLPRRAAQ
jgi:vitamin B12/bleomycin/antimicrobial peptide transport system ATP-binding/permease protein